MRHDPQGLGDLLAAQGLAPLWSSPATLAGLGVALPGGLLDALRRARDASVARYLLQRRAAVRACAALARADLPCALIKGAALREWLYAPAALRPADDVDILVAPEHRDCAVRALAGAGFAFYGMRQTISHEATLSDGYTSVDLHWHLFRPGRSRIDLAQVLMQAGRTDGPLPHLHADANLLIGLVHPAFAKHVNGRASKLIRAVDLDRHLRTAPPDWHWIMGVLESAGLRVAAWATLHWLGSLLDTPLDHAVLERLAPGPVQRRYLAFWIDRRLPDALGTVPGLVQGAFTLALHQRPADALRAATALARCRLEAGSTLNLLQDIARASRPTREPGSG